MTSLTTELPDTLTDEAAIPTPSMVVDWDVAVANARAEQDYCNEHGLDLRPHSKTHKSLRLARLQLDTGAIGLTVAKVGEAMVMKEVCDDLLLAYPAVDAARAEQVARLAAEITIRVAVDSPRAVDLLSAAADRAGTTVGLLVDVDTGFHRTGLQSPELGQQLAQHIEKSPGVRVDGIFTYPGHIHWHDDNVDEEFDLVNRVLDKTLELFKQDGHDTGIVSGGNTPASRCAHRVNAYTEVRPGTYIYNDANCVYAKWCESIDNAAASIVCTVASDAVPGKVVLDCGSKTLFSDRHATLGVEGGFGLIKEYPDAVITRLSEEHGEVSFPEGMQRPAVGDRLHVIPNHICPAVNLQDFFWLKEGGEYHRLPVDGRGKLT